MTPGSPDRSCRKNLLSEKMGKGKIAGLQKEGMS
jgi:hypothetical protein